MKTLSVLAMGLGFFCAAQSARAQSAMQTSLPQAGTAKIHIVAGDLGDAIESLAKQAGVNVLYPGDLLEGYTTSGLEGELSPTQAFARLLEGTPLTISELEGDVQILQRPSPPTVQPPAGAAVPSPGAALNWMSHEIRISCGRCDWSVQMMKLLERLGATGVAVGPHVAQFVSLTSVPRGYAASFQAQPATRWEKVTLDISGLTPAALSRSERIAWPGTLRNQILPLFVTRDLRTGDNRITFEVMVPGAREATVECNRVVHQGRSQRLCGSAAQWKEMQARLGLSCRKVGDPVTTGSHIVRSGKSESVCASPETWLRSRSGQPSYFSSGESTTEVNHPTNRFEGTPIFPQ